MRLIVFQAPEQTTIMDADKPNRAGVGFERVGEFVAENLLVVIPLHGLAVDDFDLWKRNREAEGTMFHRVETTFERRSGSAKGSVGSLEARSLRSPHCGLVAPYIEFRGRPWGSRTLT